MKFDQKLKSKIANIKKTHLALIIALVLLLVLGITTANKDRTEPIDDKDFSKGVLALNTDKSSYTSGESVLFLMGSLDSKGETLCKSTLQLEIINSNKKEITTLSTTNNEIITTPTCGENNVTNEPDYIARYKTPDTLPSGRYALKLTNLDTGKKLVSSFEVTPSESDFIISRYSAPRINPFKANSYPMVITLKAQKDISGKFEEVIPANFNIIWNGSAKIDESTDEKRLTWDLNIKAGETKEFRYEYQAPQVSPDFIRLGKAVIKNKIGLTAFTETENWTIASDANCVSAGTGNWNAITWTNCASGPTSADSVQLSGNNTVTMNVDASILYLVIDAGSTLQFSGTRTLTLTSTTSARTFIANSGTYTSNGAETISIAVTTPAGNQTISSGTVQVYNLSVTSNLGTARTYSLGTAFGVTNNMTLAPSGTGNVTLTVNPTKSGTTAVGGTITLTSVGASNNKVALDLTTTSGRNMSANNIVIGSNSTFRGRTNTLTLSGTSGTLFANSGTFTRDTCTVSITSASGTPNLLSAATTFHILTINSAATVINANQAITIGNTAGAQLNVTAGVLNDSGYGITGPGGTNGTLTVSAGASLCLGGAATNTSATCDSNATSTNSRTLPTFNAYSFAATSNMYYLSNIDTTISSTPTYGNLIFSPVLSANRIYTAGGAMTINGNLTVNPSGTANSLTFRLAGTTTIAATKTTTLTRTGSNATSVIDTRPSTTDYDLSTGFLNITAYGTLDAGSSASNITLTGTSTSASIFTRDASGTFTQGSSTVIFSGDGNINSSGALFSTDTTLYNLSITPTITGNRAYNIGVALSNVGNNLTINPSGAGLNYTLTVNMGGNITVAATGTTTVTGTSSGSSVLDLRPVSTDYNLTTGLINIGTGGTIDATSAASTITLTGTSGTLFTSSGTFTSGSSTVVFNGDGTPTALTSGTFTSTSALNNLSLTPSISSAGRTYTFGTGAIEVNGNFTIQPSGTQLLTVNMAGNITVVATGTTTISRSSTATSTLATGASNPTLSTGSLTISTGGTLDGTSSSSTIALTATSGTPFTISGTFTPGSTTVSYAPASGTAVTVTSTTYHHVTLNHTGTTFSLTTGGITTDSGGNLTITAGVLDAVNGSNYPITVGGGWINSVGTGGFTARSGTVTFNQSGTATISGATNFYNFTVTTAGKNLQFTAGQTFRIDGAFTITGTSSSYITITSSTGASTWTINHQGTESVTYADISWGACDGSSTTVTATNAIDSGNNGTCWSIASPYGSSHTDLPLPRAFFSFDEGGGNSTGDKSNQGATATLSNATWQLTGGDQNDSNKRSIFIRFDGNNSVSRAYDIAYNFGTSSFAITGWFRHPTAASGTQTILSRASGVNGVGYKVYMDSSGHICFGIDASAGSFPNDSACSTQTFGSDANWHHFAAQKTSTTSISIYIDGRISSTTTGITSGSLNGSAALYIGTDVDGLTNGWIGDIDNIVLYPSTLTVNQIAADMLDPSSALFGTTPTDTLTNGLVGYWEMDNTSASGVTPDSSGNRYSLVEVNTPTYPVGKFSTGAGLTSTSSEYLRFTSGTITLQPNEGDATDVLLNSCSPDTNYANDPALTVEDGGCSYVSLIKFDLSSIPAGATITSATLSLYVYNASGDTVTVNRILSGNSGWTETGATWNSQYGSTPWAGSASAGTSGTDYASTAIGSFTASLGTHNITLDTTETGLMFANNYGMRLSTTGAQAAMESASNGGGHLPQLTVSYTAPTPTNLNITGSLTTSAWINPSSNSGSTQYDILGKWDGSNTSYLLAQYGAELRLYLNSTSNYVTSTNANLSTGTWYHVIAVYDAQNSSVKLYLNGTPLSTTTTGTIPSSLNSNSGVFHIGAQDSTTTATNFFNGTIDEARIYNRAITPTEAQNLYNYAKGPLGWWKLDENTGSTVYDSSGNSISGTLQNNPKWKEGKFGSSLYFTKSSNQYVTLQNAGEFNVKGANSYTWEAWVKPSSFAEWNTVWGQLEAGQGIEIQAHTTTDSTWGPVTAGISAGWFNFSGGVMLHSYDNVLTLNQWYHIAVTYDGSQALDSRLTIFVNGIDQTDRTDVTTSGTPPDLIPDTVYIGWDTYSSEYMDGNIDDLRYYGYERTKKQIIQDMNAGHPMGGSPIGSQTVYWKFDEQQGQVVNNTNPLYTFTTTLGTTSGSESSDPGWYLENNCKLNGCLNFDGSDDVLTITNNTNIDLNDNLSSGFTISAWIYPDGAGEGSGGRIFYKGTNTWLRVDTLSGGRLDIEASLDLATTDATLNVSSQIVQSAWNHVAMSYTDDADDEITIWVNGKAVGTSTNGVGSPAADTANLLIGGDSSNNFDGRIDEFKIYAAELSDAEMRIDVLANTTAAMGGVVGTHDNEGFSGNSPVGWWKLDENTGSAANDSSGNSLTGTWSGTGKRWTQGKVGSAGNFSASTDDNISISDNSVLDGMSSLTVEAWVKLTAYPAASNYYLIVNKEGSYRIIESTTDGGFDFVIATTNNTWYSAGTYASTGASACAVGEWCHIVGYYNGTRVYIYVNGQYKGQGSQDISGTVVNNANGVSIGTGGSVPYETNGAIDEVKIYNYARSATQIAYDYNRGAPIVWYKMDECTGGTVYNAATNANGTQLTGYDGTINLDTTGTQTTAIGNGTCTTNAQTPRYNGRTGKYGSSINLDGTNDYIDLGDLTFTEGVSQLSWSFWVNWNSLDQGRILLGKGNGSSATQESWLFSTAASTANQLIACFTTSTTDPCGNYGYLSNAFTQTGVWYHFVIVFDGTLSGNDQRLKIYRNGIQMPLTDTSGYIGTIPASTQATTSNARIGSTSDGTAGTFFGGKIDDVRIFNYPVSADQAKKLYNEGSSVRFGN